MKKAIVSILVVTIMLMVFTPVTPIAYAASNEQIIYEYLVNTMGLNTAAACGVLANIENESDFNPNLYGDKIDGQFTSYGICQWHNERWTALKNYCNNHGYNWESLTGQLHYLEYELKNESRFSLVWSTLTSVPNTAQGCYDAAYRWCYSFEVPHYYDSPYQGYNSESEYRAYYAKNTYWPKYQNAASSGYLSSCTQYPSYCTVKITKNSAPIWTLPCNSTTDASSKIIETASSGNTYTATKLILNDQGNYWYRVTSKTGETGYLFAGNCSYQSSINDLAIENASAPPTLDKGSSWPITGTVTTINSELTKVSGYVYAGTNTSGTSETGDTVNASGQSYYLPGSALDQAMVFGILGSGRHTYVISAKSISYYATSASQRASVTNSKTLYTAGFNVKGTASNYNNYLPVGQLTRFYGTTKMVYVSGWAYDDDFVDRILSIYITIGGVQQSNSLIADTYCEECPTEGKYHGFSGYIWTEMVGEYEVCVYAKNVDEFGNETSTDTMLSSATMTILPEHTHQYEAVVIEPTCTEQGYTLHQCSCGDHYEDTYTDMVDHDYTGVRVDTEPTLTTGGYLIWFCCNCSEADGQSIPSLSTSGAYQKVEVTTANCTQKGLSRYFLLNVRNTDLESFIYFDVEENATGHNYQSTLIPPTCTEQGYTEKRCTVCDDSSIEDIVAPLGHAYVNGVCTRCGEADPTVKKGDLNGDGDITSADAVMLARYLADLIDLTEKQLLAADLNGDGEITSADAVRMARYLAGLIESLY